MAERYEPLPRDATFFRLAIRGSNFLPEGALVPDPLWFRPTSDDVREAGLRGRSPGLSVWDVARTSVRAARVLTNRKRGQAFALTVARVTEIGEQLGVELDVVADPLDDAAPAEGWEGHALLEGVARPPGGSKPAYQRLRASLSESCTPLAPR